MLKKGERIGFVDGKLQYGNDPCYGTITDELSDGRVMIKWDNKWMNDRASPVDQKNLFPEADIKAKYSVLETEFQHVADEVSRKLQTAGQIILDARNFAKEAGFDLHEMYEATSSLEKAMGKAGWNTSSWNC